MSVFDVLLEAMFNLKIRQPGTVLAEIRITFRLMYSLTEGMDLVNKKLEQRMMKAFFSITLQISPSSVSRL